MGMRTLSLFRCFKDSGRREIICRGGDAPSAVDSGINPGGGIEEGIDAAVFEEDCSENYVMNDLCPVRPLTNPSSTPSGAKQAAEKARIRAKSPKKHASRG